MADDIAEHSSPVAEPIPKADRHPSYGLHIVEVHVDQTGVVTSSVIQRTRKAGLVGGTETSSTDNGHLKSEADDRSE